MPFCISCGQENPDVAKFCLACGSPMATAPAAAPAPAPAPVETRVEERRLVTAVFTDIVGSTASAEALDPEDVRARLAPYYVEARRELELHGGSVAKFIGDAVVALFGAPTSHEDDEERAVRAAIAVTKAIEELNATDDWLNLNIRTGINTGEAIVVIGSNPGEEIGEAAGDVMNTAARIQGGAPINGIVVGELTYQRTKHAIEYREAEPVVAKGKTEPVPIWEVVNAREAPTRRETRRGTLVGREEELAKLLGLWEQVMGERLPGTATVVGSPGIGKSRLLEEVGARTADVGTMLWGRCLPYGEGITYWAVAEIMKGSAGILQSEETAEISTKLGALLEEIGRGNLDELRTMAAAASNILGVSTTPRGTYSATEITQAELHWGLRRILQLLAKKRPLLLVFEDLHWAEPTLIEFIRFLVEDEADTPLLVVASARPELVESMPELLRERERRVAIELEPLTTEVDPDALGSRRRRLDRLASQRGAGRARADESPVPDRVASRPADASGAARRATCFGRRQHVLARGGRAFAGRDGNDGRRRAPAAHRRAGAARSRPGARAVVGRRRARVRLQAHHHSRRRVRPDAEGPPRAAPSPFRRLGGRPSRPRRVRRDRCVPPGTGVPSYSRDREGDDRAADRAGRACAVACRRAGGSARGHARSGPFLRTSARDRRVRQRGGARAALAPRDRPDRPREGPGRARAPGADRRPGAGRGPP
ncbi:MAG: zinc-ribbon domain-containing protein [Actinobacteria bacterium]|nr:MAG: zinc-ribbon domain-containing protein [Actinomycetota bacterium]